MYVLIIFIYANYGLTISQQVYNGKRSCEDAAAVVTEVVQQGSSVKIPVKVKTSCVPQNRNLP